MKKNIVGFVPHILSFLMLICCVTYFSLNKPKNQQTFENVSDFSAESSISENIEKSNDIIKNNDKEMRGIWIPYMSLDLSDTNRTKEDFCKKADKIIQDCIKYKANTIIVQVRPFSDSIYPSEFFPWSHIISGTQGKGVDYDPLEYIVQQAHKNNLDVHAWVNPLRISTSKTPPVLSQDNPYEIFKNDSNSENDDYTFEYNDGIYYNPSYPQVRKLIIDGICEIVKNYDVDGIHLDDYFYPSEEPDYDKASYQKYVDSLEKDSIPLSQEKWRCSNINSLISGIYSAVHSIRNNVVFGISPQGNIENDLKMSADVYEWCSINGYVDYICPQIYVNNKHPVLPFNNTADRWKKLIKADNIKLYLGLGIYKAGTDADSGTWLLDDDNIKQQIEYCREIKTDGFMLYSYEYLENDKSEKEIQNAMAVIEAS